MRLRACTAKEANVARPVMVHLLQQLCLTTHDAMQIYTHKTINVTSSAKTGEKTFEHLKEEIELLETAHKVPVIAVISDAAGEAAKARRLLRQWKPSLVTLPCFAHQFNLSVGGELQPKLCCNWFLLIRPIVH